MSYDRAVCLSKPKTSVSTSDLVQIVRDYPRRRVLSGLSAKAIRLGDQIALMLEGPSGAVDQVIKRLNRDASAAGMEARYRSTSNERATSSLAIEEHDVDELKRHDSQQAEAVTNALISVFSNTQSADEDAFAELANLLDAKSTAHPVSRSGSVAA
ncbi:MAG: hypothetical protein AAGJ46_03885 [Planctomycetota bacterium]